MKDRNAGTFAAAAAIGAVVTAGFSWLPVLLGWGISTILMLILPERGPLRDRKTAALVLLGSVAVLAAAALGAEDAFPEDSTFPFVSAALLLLLWRAMCGERRTAGDVANVLGLFLLPVLAAVVIFGLPNVRWTETAPVCPWRQVLITVAAASPWWGLRRGARSRRTWAWYGASAGVCLGFSLLTWGILGRGLTAAEAYPLYRAVQTIRILGVLQRFEALLAAAVLMGTFSVMLLTGERAAEALALFSPDRKRTWKSGLICLGAFAAEWVLRWAPEGARSVAETVFWALIPLAALAVVLLEKHEKKEEKA